MNATSLKRISELHPLLQQRGCIQREAYLRRSRRNRQVRRGSRWRKPNITFPHRYVLIKDPPTLDPHFSRGPSFASFLLPFIFRRLNINAVLPASNIKSLYVRPSGIFVILRVVIVCVIRGIIFKFPRVCETHRRRRDGHACSLARSFFFPRLRFHGKLSEPMFVSDAFASSSREKSTYQSQQMGLFPGEKGKRFIYIPAEYPINYFNKIL